ncbi:MAG: hypothetical protein HFG37_02265 [Eubacterium sp.]|nr:hypothetical protein [Eubacterium sp.]
MRGEENVTAKGSVLEFGASLNDEPAEQAKSVRGVEDVTVKGNALEPALVVK